MESTTGAAGTANTLEVTESGKQIPSLFITSERGISAPTQFAHSTVPTAAAVAAAVAGAFVLSGGVVRARAKALLVWNMPIAQRHPARRHTHRRRQGGR